MAKSIEDLDEDLFNFGELYEEDDDNPSEEIDVEAFLAAADGAGEGDGDALTDGSVDEVDPSLMALPSTDELERLLRAANEGATGGSGELVKLVKIGGVVLLLINLLAVGAVFASRSGESAKLDAVTDEFTRTARELRNDVSQQVDAIRGINAPVPVVPLALEPETFERVRRALDSGDFKSARRQLYAALSTADRLDEDQRRNFEAEASFLLADTYRIEADRREVTP